MEERRLRVFWKKKKVGWGLEEDKSDWSIEESVIHLFLISRNEHLIDYGFKGSLRDWRDEGTDCKHNANGRVPDRAVGWSGQSGADCEWPEVSSALIPLASRMHWGNILLSHPNTSLSTSLSLIYRLLSPCTQPCKNNTTIRMLIQWLISNSIFLRIHYCFFKGRNT